MFNRAESYQVNSTLVLDMSHSWTNSTVPIGQIARGNAPLLNTAALWVDVSGSSFYRFGGNVPWGLWWFKKEEVVPQKLWKFTPDNTGGGQWIEQSPSKDDFTNISPMFGAETCGNGVGYYWGGRYGAMNMPNVTGHTFIPGLYVFNTTTQKGYNLTLPGENTGGYGQSHFVPSWGSEGLVVTVAMMRPFQDFNSTTTHDYWLDTVDIYDPGEKKWYKQRTSGPHPLWRYLFCLAGVQGDNGTYEMCETNFHLGENAYPTKLTGLQNLVRRHRTCQ